MVPSGFWCPTGLCYLRILFLVAIDWIMREITSDKPRGIQWTLFSQLEDLDFADLAVLSSKHVHLQEKTDRLNSYAKQTGLNICSASKTKVMCINTTPTAPITVNGDPLEYVKDFTYLRSLISEDNAAIKDIKARLTKACSAFARLQPIWKSKQYSLRTKVRLYIYM